ncbi:hypothetical protein R2P79_15870, partial [Faecalibacterium duncaniae]|uniref:hypothetical protein n=1 Tax=Faecalibacterium duncaniae (strain DSM 17677 / JCM 31915 / A2-165) TaxID=411483 RepID=UPI002940B19B
LTLLYSFFKNPQLLWVQFNAPFFQKKIGKSINKLLTNTLARFVLKGRRQRHERKNYCIQGDEPGYDLPGQKV